MSDGTGLFLKAGRGVVGYTYDSAAVSFFARMSNQPTQARAILYSNFFAALRNAGILSVMDAVYMFAAADSQASLLNLVQNAYNATVVGGPTFAANKGYTGTGVSNDHLNTLVFPTTSPSLNLGLTSGHLSAWSLSAVPNGGLIGTDGDSTLSILVNAGAMLGRVFDLDATTQPLAAGFYTASRTGATARSIYLNAVGTATAATGTGTLTAGNVTILEAGASFSSSQVAFATIGGGLTQANVTALYNAARTYLQGVGAV